MIFPINRKVLATGVWLLFFAGRLIAADTNDAAAITRGEILDDFSQIQRQLRATQDSIEENQAAMLGNGQSNALLIARQVQSLDQTVASRQIGDAEEARKTQQLTLLIAGAFGAVVFGFMFLMAYFQWRAMNQLARIGLSQSAVMANGDSHHQLGAPRLPKVERSTLELLNVVSKLEKHIGEMEAGKPLVPDADPDNSPALLAEGQKNIEANLPQEALECFDKFLAIQPGRADVMVKRAAILEKLGRDEEALDGYNHAIAADDRMIVAQLHKGGLLNRLRRYDEALNCYEQALLGRDKKAGA